jgi:haloacetate dehalogenase
MAPTLTIVCPDLRGYGQSSKPPTTPNHEPYGKRAMARDAVTLMAHLGFERFSVVGHDRGAYVAARLALDHPDHVERIAVLDAVPIAEALRRCDARFAQAWWHWFFLGQTTKPAEQLINADPDAWYQVSARHMGPDAFVDLRAALRDPATVHAMCVTRCRTVSFGDH